MGKISRVASWRHVLCALAIVAGHGGAGAQVASADGLPEALKGIQRATGVCRRDDAAPVLGTAAAPAVSPDLGCAISPAELRPMLALTDTAVVDLRAPTAYQAFHIEGALNLSSLDLHSKPYWRSKAVVLVGDGRAEHELYRECTRLKRLGYKRVAVLRGGMPLWLAAGQPAAGRAPAATQLARLTASEFRQESGHMNNLVVLSKLQSALQSDFPNVPMLPEVTPASLKAMLDRQRKERKTALSAVVLATHSGVADQEIALMQNALMPIPLLVYTDTREAYVRQVAVQKAIWSAQARGPKLPACGK